MFTAQAVVLGFLLLLAWALLFSRFRWRLRIGLLAGLIALGAAAGGMLRIRGVSGDLLPIVEWRWKRPPVTLPRLSREKVAIGKAALSDSLTNSYPQFLGPTRDGIVHGPPLATNWNATPPQLLWRQPVGPAWSGFAIQGRFAITQEQRGADETVVCYDLISGVSLWSHADPLHYQTTIAGEGPRATPTIAGAQVYAMGATGLLNCLDLATGEVLWSKNVPQDNDGHPGEWGISCSPLVTSNLVLVTTGAAEGRSLAAYDAASGARIWTGGNDVASYSSPTVLTLSGEPQVVIFTAKGVAGHALSRGTVLWQHPWPGGHPHIVVPLLIGPERLLVSSGYGTGSELLQIQRQPNASWKVDRIWKSIRLKSKFANIVFHDGFVYGLDDGILVCLNAATGELQWKQGRYGHGQMILTNGLLLLMAENGSVLLLEASPQGPRELSRLAALTGKTWNPPALAGRHLVVRNDQEAACYLLKAVPP